METSPQYRVLFFNEKQRLHNFGLLSTGLHDENFISLKQTNLAESQKIAKIEFLRSEKLDA